MADGTITVQNTNTTVTVDGKPITVSMLSPIAASVLNMAMTARDQAVAAAATVNNPNVAVVGADLLLGSSSKIAIVAADKTNIDTVAGDHAALVAVANDLVNIDNVANNMVSIQGVAAAAATAGVWPNAAATSVPRGAISVSVTNAGSGGTNSLNNSVTFTGSTYTSDPKILYDVVGGAITNVRLTFSGYLIATTPTATPVLPNTAGGATISITTARLYSPGQGYWVVSADGRQLNRYVNVANSPALDTAVPPIYLKPVVDDLINGAGRENLWPDPYFSLAKSGSGLAVGNGPRLTTIPSFMTVVPATLAGSDGKKLQKTSATEDGPRLFTENAGLVAGDVIRVGIIASRTSGSTPAGVAHCRYFFVNRYGTTIGAIADLFTSTAAYPHDTTPKTWTSGDITVPTNAFQLVIAYGNANVGGVTFELHSMWMHKASVPGAPVDNPTISRGQARLALLESRDLVTNGITLSTNSYTSYTIGFAGSTGIAQEVNRSNFAQSRLKTSAPASFNAVGIPANWYANNPGVNPPSKIIVEIGTSTTASGLHPANGRTVARGMVTVDPNNPSGYTVILLRSLVTGELITVNNADLDDKWCVRTMFVTADDTVATGVWIPVGTGTYDTAFPYSYSTGNPEGLAWVEVSGDIAGADLLTVTGGAARSSDPSPSFSSKVGAYVDEFATLLALPKKVACVVGRAASVYYDNISTRPRSRTNFTTLWSSAAPAGTMQEERINYIPTAAGSKTATVSSYQGSTFIDKRTCEFVSVAASAAAGMKVCLFIGDSLIANGGTLAAMKVIEASQAVTQLSFLGTKGTSPTWCEAVSGSPLGAWRGPNVLGQPNPFWNGTDFNFPTFLANSTIAAQLAALGKTEPDFVFIEGGQNETGPTLSDIDAKAFSAGVVANAEFMIANIKANTTNTKCVVYTATAGPVNSEEQSQTYGAQWRMRKNWMILAGAQIAAFSGREAQRIYCVATGASIDPVMGWPRAFVPRSDAVIRDRIVYATYAGMPLTQGDGKLAYVTDLGAYMVKVGTSGSGYWRPAVESDGFIWRVTDTIHYGLGAIQVAEANWAMIKNYG
jgi:hypothetical protein